VTATQIPPGPYEPGAPSYEEPTRSEPDAKKGRLATLLDKYRSAFSVARSTLFWACLSRQKRTLKWLFGILLVAGLGQLQIANLTRGMVDNAIVEQSAPLWPYVTHIAFWGVWTLVFGFIQSQIGERLSYSIEFDLRVWLYTHIQSADLRNLDRVATGQLVTRSITDLQLVEQLLRIFPTLIGIAPLLVALAAIVIILNPFIGILAVLALPINISILRRFSRRLRALSWAELNERAEVTRAIDEPVRGIRVVKAFGREPDETKRVEEITGRAFVYSMTRTRLLAKYDGYMKVVPVVVSAALLAVGAWQVSIEALSLGTFLLAFQLGAGLNQLASVFDELSSAWQYLRGAQDRLAEMLALSSRPVTDGRMVPAPANGLELDRIAVQYGNRRFLHGLSLDVAPGEFVVVHGAPGSGKSTLAGISAGLVLVDEGTAFLDGLPLDELDPAELRRAIRVVSEEPLLLAASLRDNLLLGAWGEIDDAELVRALRVAGADEVIDEMEGGLDGSIGDRGLTVSGGQRQRISLARALVARPRVLVLDDALSAVNPSLEIEIMSRVRQFLPDTSILYITRRAGLVDLADRSVELGDPVVVEESEAADVPVASFVLDEDEDLTIPEITDGAETATSVMAIEEAGLAAEQAAEAAAPTESIIHRADTSGLARIDAGLASMVDALELSKDRADVPDELVYRDTLDKVREIVKPFGRLVAIALVMVVFLALAQISPDLIFGQVADLVGDPPDTNLPAALAASGALLVIGAFTGVLAWRFRILAQKLTQSIILLLRRRVFRRLTRLGINYYDKELPGDVATRIVADLDNILRFVQGPGFIFVSRLAITVIGLTAILVLAPMTWPVVVIGVGLMLLVTWIQLPIATNGFGWAREELQVVTRKFQEDFTARHEIRHLGAHAIQTQKYVEACWDRRRSRWWATTVQNSQSVMLNFLSILMSAMLLFKTGQGVLAQEISVGTALAVQVLANTATLPLRTLGQLYNQLLDVRISWRRLKEPFQEPILPIEAPGSRPCDDPIATIRFEDVSFTYPGTNREVLKSTSFSMAPHEVTALVGYTGAGKSSIQKLLTRMYDPDGGRITLDGVDIRDFTLDSYRGRIGIVPQDPFVFKGTVASNIRYGDPDATDADVEAAVQAVGASALLSVLEGGFDHPVEEEGHNLTAAQRQLIALARAWLAKPDLLVLDEATSLLDHDVEDQVIAAVHELGCTTLMITHRENVANLADNIVVLESGRVVDEGPEDVVARPGGPYERLWRVVEDTGTGSLLHAEDVVDAGDSAD
jgi:ATP-binding cassette, subfamily B, bacterial